MSLESYKITDSAISTKGVVAAPDKLTGSAAQNKAIFDRLIRESVKSLYNGLIDAITATTGAGEVGTTEIEGVTGSDVQTVLGSLKTILDTKSASADTTAALALKSDKSVTDLHFKSVSLDAETGVFTFTREDNSYVTIDTVLEKVATNWTYDADTQSLVLTLADGSSVSVPLSAFITETEFVDSDQIDFSVSNHTVTATVKAGSITDSMLASALVTQLQGYVTAASGSAGDALQYKNAAEGYKNAAATSATKAEAWATGGSSGTPGEENNAKYYSGQASGSATAASGSATLAESYAKGGTSSRTGEDTDNALYYKQQAASSASAASGSATAAGGSASDSEAYAAGTRNGVDVESTDPAYHNNAKYYKDQAAAIVGGDYVTRSELADKEETSTASKAYAVGEYLVYNSTFYRVTAAIAQGGTITPGTNVVSVKLGDEIETKGKQVRTVSVTLSTAWVGNASPYTQTVNITGTTANSKVDLEPNATVLGQMATDKVTALYIENNAGTLTAYAIGKQAPSAQMTVQASITEVTT